MQSVEGQSLPAVQRQISHSESRVLYLPQLQELTPSNTTHANYQQNLTLHILKEETRYS